MGLVAMNHLRSKARVMFDLSCYGECVSRRRALYLSWQLSKTCKNCREHQVMRPLLPPIKYPMLRFIPDCYSADQCFVSRQTVLGSIPGLP